MLGLNNKRFLIQKATYLLLFFYLLYLILIEFKGFLYPIVLAILFAFLFYPLANYIEKLGTNRIIANIISLVIGMSVFYVAGFFVYKGLSAFLSDIPAMERQAQSNLYTLVHGIEEALQLEKGTINLGDLLREAFTFGRENLNKMLGGTATTLFSIAFMPVFVFFFLYYRDKYRQFILMLIDKRRHTTAHNIIEQASLITQKYMSGIFVVVLILCVLNSVGLLIVGVKYAVLLGVLAAVANFIPYFGTIIGFSIPLMVALFTGESPKLALGVIVLFVIIQFIENNILTPNIVGQRVRVNPFVIILGVMFGGVVWGIPGMFLSVPIIGVIKIICDYVPSLKPWAYLLGDKGTEQHAITLGGIRNFFLIKKKREM